MSSAPIRSPDPFSTKLDFVLRALSMSHGAAASKLAVHKSLVGRWVSGAVQPSRHNLARLSAMVAERVEGFTMLDWDLPLADLAPRVQGIAEPADKPVPALALPMFEEALLATKRRATAYEGFFRSTRPHGQHPGHFIHDHIMIRSESGNLMFTMVNGPVRLEGRIVILQGKLFVSAAEMTSPTYGFAIFNGVNSDRAGRMDGIFLYCSFDLGRTPTATPVVVERVGNLLGEIAEEEARLLHMSRSQSLAHPDPDLAAFLARDVGPSAFAQGGDWLLQMKLADSWSGGLGLDGHLDPDGRTASHHGA